MNLEQEVEAVLGDFLLAVGDVDIDIYISGSHIESKSLWNEPGGRYFCAVVWSFLPGASHPEREVFVLLLLGGFRVRS